MKPLPLQSFQVGQWLVLAERHEIRCGNQSARVQPRLIAVLRRLAEEPGRTVTREALLDAAWSRRMVNDEVLSRTIADLRQALGDDAREPRYVETIPKLGYRLLAPVTWLDADQTLAADVATLAAVSAASEPSATESDDLLPRLLPAAIDSPIPAARPWTLWLGLTLMLVIATSIGWRARVPATAGAIDANLLATSQPLTSEPGWEQSPRFSNDSEWLAYSAREPGANTTKIWMRSRDGRQSRAISDGTAWDICPLFLHGDREIVYARYRDDGCELLRQSRQSDTPMRIAICAANVRSCPALSADASAVFFSAPGGPGMAAGISRLDLKSARITSLTQPSAQSGNDADPREGKDGAVYFVRGAEGERSVHRWHLGDERRLAIANSMVYGLVPLADDRLLIASDVLGFRALILFDEKSASLSLLGGRGARYPDVSARGDVVYEQASYDANLWLHRAGLADGEILTQSSRYDAYPRLSPDAKTVAFQSNREGLEGIYLLDLNTRIETRLPLPPEHRWAHPAWTTDGHSLLLTRYANNSTEIWSYRLGSEHAEPMTSFPVGAHDAQSDPDGSHVWHLWEDAANTVLRRIGGSSAEGIFQRPEAITHYSIDAQGLFFVSPDRSGALIHCAVATQTQCTTLTTAIVPNQYRNWAIADDRVYYVTLDTSGEQFIESLQLSTGATEALDWPVPSTLSRAIDVSGDGSLAIIARTDKLDIDLMWVKR